MALAVHLWSGHVIATLPEATSSSAELEIDELLAKRSAARNVVLRVPSHVPVPWMIANSDLIATVPHLLVDVIGERFPIARYKPPLPLQPVPISIIWHDRTHQVPKHEWLRKAIVELFREATRGQENKPTPLRPR